MEEESLEMVTRREASLGIFHAVGKVVYNKRDEVHLAYLLIGTWNSYQRSCLSTLVRNDHKSRSTSS